MKRTLVVLAVGLLLAPSALIAQKDDAIARRARHLHFSSLVVDTHIDVTPKLQRPGWSFAEEHKDGHVDLPRLRKGGA